MSNLHANRLAGDLNAILSATESSWQDLKNQRIFITGGTGCFGRWLLESFIWANRQLQLNARATVLTRDAVAFQTNYPHLATDPAIDFLVGDVKNFSFPRATYSHIIHAATEVIAADLYVSHPQQMLDTIIQGTAHTLEFAKQCGASRYLLLSSGAVYGRQPTELTHIPEHYLGKLPVDELKSTYGIGKYTAEHLCYLYSQQHGLRTTIARCFAVAGPYLPLDAHFALSQFLRDGLKGNPITINSPRPVYRSYLYLADLATWLWQILFHGQAARAYNVGSEHAILLTELADRVARLLTSRPSIISQPESMTQQPERYVPDTTRAQTELNLKQTVDLDTAIESMIRWHRNSD